MDALEKLLAIEEIRTLKARYFRFTDTKDWDGLRTLFADDMVMDISDDRPGTDPITGGDKIMQMIREGLSGCVTVHHGHMPEIEILSGTEATGIWPMEDRLYWGDDSDTPGQRLNGCGHYHETYEKIAGRWAIKTTRIARLRLEFTPALSNGDL